MQTHIGGERKPGGRCCAHFVKAPGSGSKTPPFGADADRSAEGGAPKLATSPNPSGEDRGLHCAGAHAHAERTSKHHDDRDLDAPRAQQHAARHLRTHRRAGRRTNVERSRQAHRTADRGCRRRSRPIRTTRVRSFSRRFRRRFELRPRSGLDRLWWRVLRDRIGCLWVAHQQLGIDGHRDNEGGRRRDHIARRVLEHAMLGHLADRQFEICSPSGFTCRDRDPGPNAARVSGRRLQELPYPIAHRRLVRACRWRVPPHVEPRRQQQRERKREPHAAGRIPRACRRDRERRGDVSSRPQRARRIGVATAQLRLLGWPFVDTRASATFLAALTGTALTLACNKQDSGATEVPGSTTATTADASGEHACGNHAEGACSAAPRKDAGPAPATVRSFGLAPGKFAEANLQMKRGATVTATFAEGSADLTWDIHSHDHSGETKIHDHGVGGSGTVEFTAPEDGVFSILWKNGGATLSSLEVSISLGDGTSIHSWMPAQ